MAKAAFEAQLSPNDQPNQQQTSQIYKLIPHPRQEIIDVSEPSDSPRIVLIPDEISEDEKIQAAKYIEQQLKNQSAIRAGSFLIGLLEKLHTIPNEMAAEDNVLRKVAIDRLDELIIEVQKYADESGHFNNAQFTEEVTNTINSEAIKNNDTFQLLRGAIGQVRRIANKNSVAETQLVTAQRIALLGIAKQISG